MSLLSKALDHDLKLVMCVLKPNPKNPEEKAYYAYLIPRSIRQDHIERWLQSPDPKAILLLQRLLTCSWFPFGLGAYTQQPFDHIIQKLQVTEEKGFDELSLAISSFNHYLSTGNIPPSKSAEQFMDGCRQSKYGTPVGELSIGVRAINCLKAEGIILVGELLKRSRTNLLHIMNLGPKGLQEVEEGLAEHGLFLREHGAREPARFNPDL
jgi:hypothetical protein